MPKIVRFGFQFGIDLWLRIWTNRSLRPFTERFIVERLVLMCGVVVFPVLAIALGICIAILANALR